MGEGRHLQEKADVFKTEGGRRALTYKNVML